ncbi:HSP20-like chaperone [Flammula alnicola]|nr:HSP20-like chaperone [Flammula alnicola]
MTTRTQRPNPKFDSITFQMFQHPTFVQAVNRAANIKCLEAIRAGRLRVVQPNDLRGAFRYSPRMDLVDDPTSSKFTAFFELPGIKSTDISLQIRDNHLVVFGERSPPQLSAAQREALPQNPIATANALESGEMETDDQHKEVPLQRPRLPVQELRYGTFQRAIRVPDGIKESDVSATLHEGMLTVTWPKSPAAQIATPARTPNTTSPPASVVTAGTALQ